MAGDLLTGSQYATTKHHRTHIVHSEEVTVMALRYILRILFITKQLSLATRTTAHGRSILSLSDLAVLYCI